MSEVVKRGPEVWNWRCECERCGTIYDVDQHDVQFDRFKEPGTYWFDGSAGRGSPRFFVECPECHKLAFVEDDSLPYLVRKKVKEESNKT